MRIEECFRKKFVLVVQRVYDSIDLAYLLSKSQQIRARLHSKHARKRTEPRNKMSSLISMKRAVRIAAQSLSSSSNFTVNKRVRSILCHRNHRQRNIDRFIPRAKEKSEEEEEEEEEEEKRVSKERGRFKRRAADARTPKAPLGSGPNTVFQETSADEEKIETIAIGRTRFEGVATVDNERDELSGSNVLKRRAILFSGDLVCLSVFAAIGRASHGEGVDVIGVASTAAPFALGWVASSYLLGVNGAFGDSSRKSGIDKLGKILPSVAKTIALGIPIGVSIRAMTTFHVPDISFLVVSLGFNGFALLLWRVAFASDIRVAGGNVITGSKKGNPLEFFSLLSSLVRRW